MIDKDYCMSSYLAFRYIEREDADFYPGLKHRNFKPIPETERIPVETSAQIGEQIESQVAQLRERNKLGILLSGGMDSAIVASYMSGCDAYTFRFAGGEIQKEELARAEYYARNRGLKLHYVDIDWNTVQRHLDACMEAKAAPVHSIEPQILQGALQAQADGVTMMLVGESSDLIFGGMDQLLSRDWTVEAFARRYTFLDPAAALRKPVDTAYLFERYRLDGGRIDFLRFMDDVFSNESSGSYWNAFGVAGMPYYDPYARLKMADPLDLNRVRNGEPKYLVRGLMAQRYPEIPVPDKIPMPRPVDAYFKDWKGVTRPEFRADIDYDGLTGNQKWQLYCLERFLDIHEKAS